MLGIALALAFELGTAEPGGLGEAARQRGPTEPYHHYFLGRLSLGLGHARPSEHADLLESDGYSLGDRKYFEMAVAGVVGGRVAIGPYFALGRRTAKPTDQAPSLRETVSRVGGEASLLITPSPRFLITIGPELGAVYGTLEVHGTGSTQTVLEYGGVSHILFRLSTAAPVWYLGGTIAYTVAPADPPGGVGRDYDYGALYVGFTGVIGG